MSEIPEAACCDLHSLVVCEPDTVVTVPCCPNCPSRPTPETTSRPEDVPGELVKIFEEAWLDAAARQDSHFMHAALAAVLPAHKAMVVPPGHVVVRRDEP